jgi:hypothetical protein
MRSALTQEPPDWKEPKRRLKFAPTGSVIASSEEAAPPPAIPRPAPIKAGLPAAAKGGKADKADKENNGALFNRQGAAKAKGLGGAGGLQPRNANGAGAKPKGLAPQAKANIGKAKGPGPAAAAAAAGGGKGGKQQPKVVAVAPPAVSQPAAATSPKAATAPAAPADRVTIAPAAAPPAAPPTPPSQLRAREEAALTLMEMRYPGGEPTSATAKHLFHDPAGGGGGGGAEGSGGDEASGGDGEGASGASCSSDADAAANAASDPAMSARAVRELRETLLGKQLEVEFLLRPQLTDSAALAAARSSVSRALAFDDELAGLAAAHEMSKGRLFQALLEELRAAEAGHAQVDNSGKKGSSTDYSAEFGEARWSELAKEADNLRKLVRIKVADDNDLKTARQGLLICQEFFDGISRLGRLQGIADDFAVIEELASLTC